MESPTNFVIVKKMHQKPLRKCEVCDKTFKKLYSLTRHLKLHTGTKEFVCQFCSYDFIQKSDLKRHLSTHSDVKNFTCNFENCGKTFRTQRNMHSHQVSIHLGRSRYKCKICKMEFKFYNTLRLHRKRVHEQTKEVFECDYCGKLMHFRQYLRSHLARHISKPKDKPLIPRNLKLVHPRYFTYRQESPGTPFKESSASNLPSLGAVILQEVKIKSENLDEESIKFEIFQDDEREERNFLRSFIPLMQQMRMTEKHIFKKGVRDIIDQVLSM